MDNFPSSFLTLDVKPHTDVIDELLVLFSSTKSNASTADITGDPKMTWDYKAIMLFDPGSSFSQKLATHPELDDSFSSFDNISVDKKWDVIFQTDIQFPANKTHSDKSCEDTMKLANYLTEDGIIISLFQTLSSIRSPYEEGRFKNHLHPGSILRLPDASYSPNPIYMVCFSLRHSFNRTLFVDFQQHEQDISSNNLVYFVERHKPCKNEFKDFDELSIYLDIRARDLNYLLDKGLVKDETLLKGVREHISRFPGFVLWEYLTRLGEVESDYQSYQRVFLSNAVSSVNLTRGIFVHTESSVYIPLLKGHQAPTLLQEDIKLKHQNMCQVEVDPKVMHPNYLLSYLNSDWGRTFWNAAIDEKVGVIKKLNKKDIESLVIALPNLKIQQEIFNASTKINNVIENLEIIKNAITLNPVSATEENSKIDSIREIISEIAPLLREESKTHEFKASLRTPYPDIEPTIDDNHRQIYTLGKNILWSRKEVRNFLQDIVLKTISSLINTSGGTLLIGVHERHNEKEVVGIEREGFKSLDEYERHLSQIIVNEFSEVTASKYVRTKIIHIQNKPVCLVTCEMKTDDMPIFFRNKVYVRSGPMISELTTQQVAQMVSERKT